MTGRYFDGRRSQARLVSVAIAGRRVRLEGDAVRRDEPLETVRISDAIGDAPRFLTFPDGATCEVTDGRALTDALTREAIAPARVDSWERSGRLVLAAVLILIVAAVAAYRHGLPWAARVVADRLPASTLDILSHQMLEFLDRGVLEPSALPGPRQAAIADALRGLRLPEEMHARVALDFRASEAIGANAFALPSGAIVVTDGLLEIAQGDDEVVAVLAHEVGHVDRRHGLRGMLQASVVSLGVTWLIGDLTALPAGLAATLLNARYSRDFEREADAYASRVLQASGIPPSRLADILERMQAESKRQGGLDERAFEYLSRHPSTDERLAALRLGSP